MSVLNDVPENQVGEIVQSFVEEGKNEVRAEKLANGAWRITVDGPS